MPRRGLARVEPTLAAYYERASGKLTAEEFAARVEEEREKFDGLLDDEALALLVLDELGLNDGAFVTIAELSGRAEATVRCTIDGIEPPREFAREGRPPGRVCNCRVSDATGAARLVLWDRDVEKTEDGTLVAGARVTLVNARVKESRWGVELHAGPWTAIEVEGALTAAQRKLIQDVAVEQAEAPRAEPETLRGTLLGLTPTRTYRRDDGGVGFACDLDVETDDGRVRVVAWDDAVKAARALRPLARVVIENVTRKTRGAQDEWHTRSDTQLRAE